LLVLVLPVQVVSCMTFSGDGDVRYPDSSVPAVVVAVVRISIGTTITTTTTTTSVLFPFFSPFCSVLPVAFVVPPSILFLFCSSIFPRFLLSFLLLFGTDACGVVALFGWLACIHSFVGLEVE
jgi:hypothetical protein